MAIAWPSCSFEVRAILQFEGTQLVQAEVEKAMQFTSPMNMMDFFRKSEGTWFTQRAVHHFDVVADESGESNSRVQQVCDLQGIDSAQAVGGASFAWQDNLDEHPPNDQYAAILIDIPDDETGLSGKLLRNQGYVESIPTICRYWFGQDGILTIDTDYEKNQGQERCWFITDDFRVRVSTVRMMNGVNLMAYCSERRCVSPDALEQMVRYHLARTGNGERS
jgi:CpeS-like protein